MSVDQRVDQVATVASNDGAGTPTSLTFEIERGYAEKLLAGWSEPLRLRLERRGEKLELLAQTFDVLTDR